MSQRAWSQEVSYFQAFYPVCRYLMLFFLHSLWRCSENKMQTTLQYFITNLKMTSVSVPNFFILSKMLLPFSLYSALPDFNLKVTFNYWCIMTPSKTSYIGLGSIPSSQVLDFNSMLLTFILSLKNSNNN